MYYPQQTRPVRLFAADGRPLNLNEAKVEFSFKETDDAFILDVKTYK